ncbi:MAG TPA: GNAT family N-acetyltransferase [Casimicrobiaceae bacterium]|nr:GNAT family N-acetyltransferase [Casimicrobiaceae bacterium]
MLLPAHAGHWVFIRELVREAAAMGSVDRELASDSATAVEFFARLRRALQTNYFAEKQAHRASVPPQRVRGFVYPAPRSTLPIGFVLLKSCGGASFECWLLGVGSAYRRRGHARAMIDELLACDIGRCTHLVRCRSDGGGAAIVADIFRRHGFVAARESEADVWLLSPDAPRTLVRAVATAPGSEAAYP